jgi:hypothetical protein
MEVIPRPYPVSATALSSLLVCFRKGSERDQDRSAGAVQVESRFLWTRCGWVSERVCDAAGTKECHVPQNSCQETWPGNGSWDE